MAYLLVPISIFVRQIVPTPISFLSRIPIYAFILLIIIAILFGNNIKKHKIFSAKILLFSIVVLDLQCISMMTSYLEIGNNSFNINPIRQYLKFLIFFLCIFIHYIVVKLLIKNEKDILRFIKGNGFALVIMLIITYAQLLSLLFPGYFSWAANFIGQYLEDRIERDWYDSGSYVQTMHRINGLSSEAGFLATRLVIVFVPFVIASIKHRVNLFSHKIKYNGVAFYLLLISIGIVLFFAQTTTGILAVLLIFIFMWASLSRGRKIVFLFTIALFGTVFYFISINNPFVMETLNSNLFNKGDSASTQNRLGGTISLIKTWVSHLFIGVGWNYQVYYLFQNVPVWSTLNGEYHHIFVPLKYYPILSILFGWLAQFGLICVSFVFVYTYKLLKDLRLLSKKAKLFNIKENDLKRIDAIKDSAHYFILLYFICSLFSFDWADSIYLLMFFFFIVVRQILYEKIMELS